MRQVPVSGPCSCRRLRQAIEPELLPRGAIVMADQQVVARAGFRLPQRHQGKERLGLAGVHGQEGMPAPLTGTSSRLTLSVAEAVSVISSVSWS